jgi:hypothetical protein
MSTRDWWDWHRSYDDPESPLAHRLSIVQRQIRDAVDAAPAGPIRVVSVCAGQGRDLIGALASHPRRHDIRARLVELDSRNVVAARAALRAADLPGVTVVAGDAARTDAYLGAVPADLVLVCGVFGNVTNGDIEHTVKTLPQLCAAGATAIWTRHRRPPDLTVSIRAWFTAAGFVEHAFETVPNGSVSVGVHRFQGSPVPLKVGRCLFTFLDREPRP